MFTTPLKSIVIESAGGQEERTENDEKKKHEDFAKATQHSRRISEQFSRNALQKRKKEKARRL
ncbi:MAG: hypothetical protein JW764_08230 [Chlorobiaceae bacterium]|nr:hypothetical protein [Chlorobiaceae bacterium]